jgi:hypothetical protein
MKINVLLLTLWSNLVFGQLTNQLKSDSSDIYVHAFNQYCEQIIKYSPSITTIYIEQGKFYSHILPLKVKNLEIKKLSSKNILKVCRNGKYKYITAIIPLRNKNDVFYVGIIPFKVFAKKKKIHYVNEGGINFNYSINKETWQFGFINSQGGIPVMK